MKKLKKGVFFVEKQDGSLTDEGFVDEMLQDEDRIRQELIDKGIIKNIVLVRKKDKPHGVSFSVDKDGNATDEGLADGMLDKEAEIHSKLVEHGIMRQFVGEPKLKDKENE